MRSDLGCVDSVSDVEDVCWRDLKASRSFKVLNIIIVGKRIHLWFASHYRSELPGNTLLCLSQAFT